MDFSKVKEITIKEGSVKELSINGQVVWKKDSGPTGIPVSYNLKNKSPWNIVDTTTYEISPTSVQLTTSLSVWTTDRKKYWYEYYVDGVLKYQAPRTQTEFTIPLSNEYSAGTKSIEISDGKSFSGTYIFKINYITQ